MKGFLLKLSHGPHGHAKDAGGRTWCTDILITSLIWADDGISEHPLVIAHLYFLIVTSLRSGFDLLMWHIIASQNCSIAH